MVLYLGNMLSKHGRSVSMMETLIPRFSQAVMVRGYSGRKNKVWRVFEMLWAIWVYRKKVTIVLIDSFSTAAFYYTVAIAWLCQKLKIPYVPILHGGNYPSRLKQNPKLSAFVFQNSAINIAPSIYLGSHFKKAGFEILHIPNFLPIKSYPFLKRTTFSPKILWVRAFHEIYNPELSVKLLFELKKKYPEAELCMVGPDKDGSLDSVTRLAQFLNLTDHLHITGKLSKEEWLRLSEKYDIFINTTNFDNMPISVLEAMALGLPVVSTNVGGLPFLISHEATGLLVPPNDPKAFSEAIGRLLEHPETGRQIASEARAFAETLDWEHIEKKWLEFFERFNVKQVLSK